MHPGCIPGVRYRVTSRIVAPTVGVAAPPSTILRTYAMVAMVVSLLNLLPSPLLGVSEHKKRCGTQVGALFADRVAWGTHTIESEDIETCRETPIPSKASRDQRQEMSRYFSSVTRTPTALRGAWYSQPAMHPHALDHPINVYTPVLMRSTIEGANFLPNIF